MDTNNQTGFYSTLYLDLSDTSDENTAGILHKNDHHNHLDLNCLHKIYGNKLLCDIILIAEGLEIQAHKLLLALSSSYFYRRFAKDTHLERMNRFEIDNITYKTLSAVVRYLYCSEIFITEDNVGELLAAARMFALLDLYRACEDFLKADLTLNNCTDRWSVVRQQKCVALMPLMDEFVIDHFSEVTKLDGFLKLSYDDVFDLISRDILCAVEDDVLECVVKWVQSDVHNRKVQFYKLIQQVRFPLISSENILEKLGEEQSLKCDSEYNSFLLGILKDYILNRHPACPIIYRKSSKLLVVVGITDGNKLSMEMYNFQENIWLSWPKTLSIECNEDQRMAIVGSKIYCCNGKTWKSFDISNPNELTWSECSELLEKREKGSVAVLNNKIYNVGGFNNNQVLANVETYDLVLGKSESIADMSDARRSVGLAALNGHVYAVGGCKIISNSRTYCNSVECFQPETNSWTSMPAISIQRALPGVAVMGDSLYVVGGSNQRFCKEVESFDSTKSSWNRLPDLNITREAPGVIAVNGQLYVIGGRNSKDGDLKSVEVYDPKSKSWTMLPSLMNTGKTHVATALIEKSRIKF